MEAGPWCALNAVQLGNRRLTQFGWRDLGSNPSKGPPLRGDRVLELTAGLVVTSIAFTPDLRD
jgi:hypothetical protein